MDETAQRQRLRRGGNLTDLSQLPNPFSNSIASNRSSSIAELEEPEEGKENSDGARANNDENSDPNGNESKLALLRQLLAVERQKNQQRRQNNEQMQKYLQQLQQDYLNLQRELLEAFELANKVKGQKEAQLESLQQTLREKDKLVDQLRLEVESLDQARVKREFQELLRRQKEVSQLEQEQVRQQVTTLEQQLVHERVHNSQLLQQLQSKMDEQSKRHEKELETVRQELSRKVTELNELMEEEPRNRSLRDLREAKAKLEGQVEELSEAVVESKTRYDSLRNRLERLVREQEAMEEEQREQVDRWQEEQLAMRQQYNEVKSNLDDKEELVQIMQFNLQRSEKRAKNLLGALKGKEQAYKDIIAHMETKHQQEVEELKNRFRGIEKRLVECKDELDQKQIELMRVQLERENRLDSLRQDRDQRLQKLNQEKEKLEKQLQTLEVRLARELEQSEGRAKQVESLHQEIEHFRQESKRLSIELTKSEAKLYSQQQELSQALKERELYQTEADQHQSLAFELEDSKRMIKRLEDNISQLKTDNEKLAIKLKVNESSLNQVGAAIKKEHLKMVHEYEKRLEAIRVEQSVYDKNKLKYKRYGFKLKKYCEHLNQIHQHICQPETCGSESLMSSKIKFTSLDKIGNILE